MPLRKGEYSEREDVQKKRTFRKRGRLKRVFRKSV